MLLLLYLPLVNVGLVVWVFLFTELCLFYFFCTCYISLLKNSSPGPERECSQMVTLFRASPTYTNSRSKLLTNRSKLHSLAWFSYVANLIADIRQTPSIIADEALTMLSLLDDRRSSAPCAVTCYPENKEPC